MDSFQLKTEFITLHQLFKAAGWTQSGGDAKMIIQSGEVTVNGQTEVRRGRKLRKSDKVEWGKKGVLVC
jgi:ribosome-associated protein